MRIFITVLLLACVVAGVVFGALNADLVAFDFGFAQVSLPKGGMLLAALVLGWLLGGFTAWWGLSSRHLRERRSQGRKKARKDVANA